MASVSARLAMIGESGFVEPDQDASSALTELDKGLRSVKLGEQCEAIVRFPRLFEKYPFPILINSACLKLAEVFRYGSNFLRMLVLKVMQQSQKHLDKILNIDEFVRRIYSVIYSNDPVARALTLRTLGSIAAVVAERKNIHHSIRNSLDSHDAVELEAAIYAAGRFAAQSKIFASNICTKIGEMIQRIATPVEVKLELLSVFQHMHHDAKASAMVRKLCTDLLPAYPSRQFVVSTLHTMTQLAASSVISIPQQVKLLIHYLQEDPRSSIKMHALKDLQLLADKGAHLWSSIDVEIVINYALNTPYLGLKCKAVKVLASLACSVAVDKFAISEECKVLDLCHECVFQDNISLSACSVQLLAHLAIHVFQENIILKGVDLMQEATSAVESLLFVVCTDNDHTPIHKEALKTCFQCSVSLCDVNPDLCIQFVETLGSLVGNSNENCIISLCKALCALGNKRAGVMRCWEPELVKKVAEFSSKPHIDSQHSQALVMVCTLLFQAGIDRTWSPQESEAINRICSEALESVDMWSAYRVARQATRYGHHHCAGHIFSNLCDRVSSEHLHFWLVGLWEVSQGECCLQNRMSRGGASATPEECLLAQSVGHYMKAVSALKAATSPLHSLIFQCEYARLRSEMLQSHLQLLQACSCVKTAPPPAIAASVATASRDELQKCGRIVTQMRKCAKDFRFLADQYGVLYQSVFDADPKTLYNLQNLQQSCLLAAQAIDKLAQHNQGIGFSGAEDDILTLEQSQQTLENYRLQEACIQASLLIRDLNVDSEGRAIGRQEIDHLLKVCQELISVPLCLPRYFFQTLQSTSIKLAISPQPRMAGDPILIQHSAHFAVKVEGVVQHGARPGLYRKVAKVLLTVSSNLQTRTISLQDTKPSPDTNNLMTQTVIPHNDYFHAQFLLAFPVAGVHVVNIEAAVVDEKEAQWKTGPKMSLSVKAHDESNSQKQSSRGPYGSRF